MTFDIPSTLNKIVIAGDSCRGKTTLASKISLKLDIPVYSTDDCLYEIKFTKRRDKQEGINIIENICKNKKWIVEGSTGYLINFGLESADLIIYLEHKNVLHQWFLLIERYFKRENDEIKKVLGGMKHVFYKKYGLGYRKGQIKISTRIEPYKHKTITLSNFKQIDNFVDSL